MDFSKLAVTEVRRNPTRTRIAVLASALAAMIVILLRIIPEGYPVGIAMPERTYTGGDIVIFPAQSPLSSAENSTLVLRDWQGSDWQSQILYYFPDIVKTGYLCKEECMGWRAMVPKDVMTAISVSYTHLDVYKRQLCLLRYYGLFVFDGILRKEIARFCYVTVSYTHLTTSRDKTVNA